MKTLHRGAGRRVTLHATKAELRAIGITCNSTGYDEYRVGFADGNGEPYYTSDLQDALETGRCMAQRRNSIRFREYLLPN